jgi:hypothetical protein
MAAVHPAESIVQPGERMEHRWGHRIRCEARVKVSGGGTTCAGYLHNVSLSGAFLETDLPLLPFAQIAIAVLSHDGVTHFKELLASVVRAEPAGVGIEWLETAPGSVCQMLGCADECAAAKAHGR